MNIFFSALSAAYIAGIFLFADSPMVSDVAPFNPYSLLHIPLYGILTILLVLSFRRKPGNSTNLSREMRPAPCSVETTTSGSLFHWDPTNPINPINPTNSRNLLIAGSIALVVAIADEIHQAYLPNRDASVSDVLLDLVGIICCILLIRRFQSQSGFSKVKDFLRRITDKKAIFY
jgi:hypothetical protein